MVVVLEGLGIFRREPLGTVIVTDNLFDNDGTARSPGIWWTSML
jgi:hypothetical protein